MELDHEFTVPVPVDQAWSALLDVERVASCMPGATLDSVEGEQYTGRLKVKVGAMTITYRGSARITSADESARTVTLEAAGKEARGSGTASATVVSRLHQVPGEAGKDDTTRVTVHTELNVTGRPAQFGRNILSEVGGKLISRFAKALAAELESPASVDATGTASEAGPAETRPAGAGPAGAGTTGAETTGVETTGSAPAEAAAETAETGAPPDGGEPESEPQPESGSGSAAPKVPQQRPASTVESTSSAGPAVSPAAQDRPDRQEPQDRQQPQSRPDEAIDLMELVGPSVAKRALPAAGAVLLFLLAVRLLVRRRRRGDS